MTCTWISLYRSAGLKHDITSSASSSGTLTPFFLRTVMVPFWLPTEGAGAAVNPAKEQFADVLVITDFGMRIVKLTTENGEI